MLMCHREAFQLSGRVGLTKLQFTYWTFFFQNFLQKLGGMPPRPSLKLIVTSARTHKSLAGLKYVTKISRKAGKSMSKFFLLNYHFSNFSSKAGGQAPQTPLNVIHIIRKSIRKFIQIIFLEKKVSYFFHKKNKYKSCLMVSLLHIMCFYQQTFD